MSKQEQQMNQDLERAIRDGYVIKGMSITRDGKNWKLLDFRNQPAACFSYSAGFYAWLERSRTAGRPTVPLKHECFQRTASRPKGKAAVEATVLPSPVQLPKEAQKRIESVIAETRSARSAWHDYQIPDQSDPLFVQKHDTLKRLEQSYLNACEDEVYAWRSLCGVGI